MSDETNSRVDAIVRIVDRIGFPALIAAALMWGFYAISDRALTSLEMQVETTRMGIQVLSEIQNEQHQALMFLIDRSNDEEKDD